ncbi:LIC12628 family protein [Leptospira alstonii]|nr:hypothetical protein [Leptospira alstonii]EQA79685.1 hypothetical protein LEP1GSC193_3725 [Leptospira alstonii serovar Pingchang str. 80-412]
MIISWEKIRHQHTKEEWKNLLEKVDSVQEKRVSSHIFPEKYRTHWDVMEGITSLVLHKPN